MHLQDMPLVIKTAWFKGKTIKGDELLSVFTDAFDSALTIREHYFDGAIHLVDHSVAGQRFVLVPTLDVPYFRPDLHYPSVKIVSHPEVSGELPELVAAASSLAVTATEAIQAADHAGKIHAMIYYSG